VTDEIPASRLRPVLGFKRLAIPTVRHHTTACHCAVDRQRLQKETWLDLIEADCCLLHDPWNCNDCGLPSDDIFIVYGYIWSRACAAAPAMSELGHLCIPCIEARLGRRLNRLDFDPTVPCNYDHKWYASPLMPSRLRDAPPSPPPQRALRRARASI
jgi:hypothetical protein